MINSLILVAIGYVLCVVVSAFYPMQAMTVSNWVLDAWDWAKKKWAEFRSK